jgi:hypothetical protein
LVLLHPKNVVNLFGNWLKGIPINDLVQIRVGVCAVIWMTMWNIRNDFIFNKPKMLLPPIGNNCRALSTNFVVISDRREYHFLTLFLCDKGIDNRVRYLSTPEAR